MHWVSIGYPMLIKTKSHLKDNFTLFHKWYDGLYTKIEMLTVSQKKLIVEKIKSKYGIEVQEGQITNLHLSKFDCNLNLKCEYGREMVLNGQVRQFNEYPLRLDFVNTRVKDGCITRHLLENIDEDLSFECNIAANSKLVKQNVLKIKAEQFNEDGLVDKLFGPADQVFVTREQMASLSSNMISNLNILEEYEIPESASYSLAQTMIDEILKQINAKFTKMPFDEAIKGLSKYSTQDLDPDVITSELSNLFEIKKNREQRAHCIKSRSK